MSRTKCQSHVRAWQRRNQLEDSILARVDRQRKREREIQQLFGPDRPTGEEEGIADVEG